MMKYNHLCVYTWSATVYLIDCHTPGIITMMIVGKKSREASSKISGNEMTFVHSCIGLSSGKRLISIARANKAL